MAVSRGLHEQGIHSLLLVEQRFCREITHGLRLSIINFVFEHDPAARKDYARITPPKPPRLRQFKCSDKLHMDDLSDEFQTGHWMEHYIYGGIALGLTGQFFTDEQDPAGSRLDPGPEGVLYFRVVRLAHRVNHDGHAYQKTVGYKYDLQKQAFEEEQSIVFHRHDRTTCARGF